MARRPSDTFLRSRGPVASCTQLLAPVPSTSAALLNLKSCITNGGSTNMKTTEDQDLSVCLSDLTSHEASGRLEPFGPPLLASPPVLSVLVAGLSGQIWQRITAAVLLLPERPGQLQPVSECTTCQLALPAEFLLRGRNDGVRGARGVTTLETSPHSSHLTTWRTAEPHPQTCPVTLLLCAPTGPQEDTSSSKAMEPQQIWVGARLPLLIFTLCSFLAEPDREATRRVPWDALPVSIQF